MHQAELHRWQHTHTFGTTEVPTGERRTRWVVILTVITMFAELYAGFVFNSMALLADGWHMASHAVASGWPHLPTPLLVGMRQRPILLWHWQGECARRVRKRGWAGRRRARDLRGERRSSGFPLAIRFDEAMLVAGLGLVVNLVSAALLHEGDHHHHGHDHDHHDHNLRVPYLHVLADAVTSVLAIVALLAVSTLVGLGWTRRPAWWVSIVIARWSIGLLRPHWCGSTRRRSVPRASSSDHRGSGNGRHHQGKRPPSMASGALTISE